MIEVIGATAKNSAIVVCCAITFESSTARVQISILINQQNVRYYKMQMVALEFEFRCRKGKLLDLKSDFLTIRL